MSHQRDYQHMKASVNLAKLTVFLLSLAATSTWAADAGLHYLQPQSVQPLRLIPPPATVGSEEQRSEIDSILAVQAVRTPAQIARFKAEEKLGLGAFAAIMPSFCTADNLPKLAKLLDSTGGDAKYLTGVSKAVFQRKRPYWEDSRIQPLGKREEDMSYPSGHATKGTVWAMILAELEPDLKDKLAERGREIGWDRVIGGVHYPSDIVAGRVLGQAIAEALMASPHFQADLKVAKAEYDSLKKSHAGRLAAPVHAN
jgi:acid phosphatase (class A)